MRMKFTTSLAFAASLAIAAAGCTGGQETSAETVAAAESAAVAQIDPARELGTISPAIPIYDGASFRNDLTERDATILRNKFGNSSAVYTLVTDDSFPKVWHYYVNYLAQFRGYDPLPPYPPGNRQSRTMEVKLNQAMQDPFIPGESIPLTGKQVTLQIVESDNSRETLIRYIVFDHVPQPAADEQVATTTTSGVPAIATAAPSAGPGESEEAPTEEAR